jgi:peroxiredoxin
MAEVGEKAPDISAPDQNREAKNLGDYRGKNVILAFFPGAFTGGCTTEMCSLRDNMAMLNGMNAEVIGVSVDNPAANKAFADANQLQFTLLSDYNHKAVSSYDIPWNDFLGMEGNTVARRSIFVIDKDGVIRYKWVAAQDPVPPYDEISEALKAL